MKFFFQASRNYLIFVTLVAESRGNIINVLLILTLFLLILLGYIQNATNGEIQTEEEDETPVELDIHQIVEIPTVADQEKYFLDVRIKKIISPTRSVRLFISLDASKIFLSKRTKIFFINFEFFNWNREMQQNKTERTKSLGKILENFKIFRKISNL